jgi:tripartite-type tricarboxylate transporter receptor subunit TctC
VSLAAQIRFAAYIKTAKATGLAVAFCVGQGVGAHAEDFYHGKTVTLVVGYSSGGGYDVNARLLSRHFGRHIPGNPNVVVVNMPGAGSLRSLEHLDKQAPRDGTVIDMFDYTQITNSLLTPDKVPIDFRKFKWIGSIAQDLAVCYVWHTVNAKTLADLQKLPQIHMGRTNPGTSSDTQQRVLRKIFNVKVHSVAGYAGSAEAFIAVERGELEGGCMTWSSLPPAWIAGKKITPIMRITSATAPDLDPKVPSAFDLAPSDRDRKIMRVLSASGEVGKPFVMHLSVPDDRVTILRDAFAATMKDPAFLADAAKMRQTVTPTIGDAAVKVVDEIYGTAPDIVDAARAIAMD